MCQRKSMTLDVGEVKSLSFYLSPEQRDPSLCGQLSGSLSASFGHRKTTSRHLSPTTHKKTMKLFAFLLVVLVGVSQAFVAPSAFKGAAMTSPRAARGECLGRGILRRGCSFRGPSRLYSGARSLLPSLRWCCSPACPNDDVLCACVS